MAWTVTVAKPAQKQVTKFPTKDQQKIGVAVGAMADDPFCGDVVKLEGGRPLAPQSRQLAHLFQC
jgi:mRNA-degrading endonuclease RelE of RelBE toxin-antitoxin system